MTMWDYLHASGVLAPAFLVVVVGWALARVLRAWRDRRPVKVRLLLVCPECSAEREEPAEPAGDER
jgi:hypothetical protein